MAMAGAEVAAVLPKSEHDLNSRKGVERIKFAKALMERCKWTVQEFAERLNYADSGICGKTECGTSQITDAHLKRVFPNKGGSGIRLEANAELSEEEIGQIGQLYLAIYNHPPPNKEYARYFLRSWLAEREGKARINWAKFAYDICRKQYATWEKDGRVEEACRMKWDDLQDIQVADSVGEGPSTVHRRQFGATCEPLRFTAEQTSEVNEILKRAEVDLDGLGPKL